MNTRELTGTVVSRPSAQTAIVITRRKAVHPLYRKSYNVTKRYAVHDPEERAVVGEEVTIAACRPVSATKRFILK
jgi:small subunit ribosomal protein S17